MNAKTRVRFVYIPDYLVKEAVATEEAIKVIQRVYEAHGRGEAYLSEPPALSLHGDVGKLSSYKIKGALIPSMDVCGFRLLGNGPAPEGTEGRQFYGYCYLTDPVTSEPIALIHERYQHILRTGLSAAVALQHLGNRDSRYVGMIGSGNIARTALEGLARCFAIEEVQVYSRRESSRKRYAEEMGRKLDLTVKTAESAEQVVKESEIVVTITTADEALVSAGWLPQGSSLCSLGGNQELAPEILEEIDKLVVDDFEFCTMAGDIHAWIKKGYLGRNQIEQHLYASIGEIIAGKKPGRQGANEKIVAIIQGMASCDLAIAKLVYDRLKNSEGVQTLIMEGV
jgi:ornithine cyclodeaminase/alanine dehydrogenase-like protein (mu-crystallin family)